jgi:hypothetical protein
MDARVRATFSSNEVDPIDQVQAASSVVVAGTTCLAFECSLVTALRPIDLRNFSPERFTCDKGALQLAFRLDGFEPKRIPSPGDVATSALLVWLDRGLSPLTPTIRSKRLARLTSRSRRSQGRSRTTRGTYRALANAYLLDGHDDAATDVLVAMRQAHDPLWQRVLLRPIDQGYRPQKALRWLVGVLMITFAAAWLGESNGSFAAAQDLGQNTSVNTTALVLSNECDSHKYPCLRPELYALDTMIPVVDLNERSMWKPRTGRGLLHPETFLAWWMAFASIAGWAFGGLFVTGAINVAIEDRRRSSA